MNHLTLLAIPLFLVAPVLAQSETQLKTELRQKETAAREDADALYQVAVWAREQGFDADYKRILNNVLKENSRHEAANLDLGHVEYMGAWMTRKEMYKSMGMVEHSGVWIEKEHQEDAKNGVFHHMGEVVSREDLAAFQEGKVRHPRTGEFIPEGDVAVAAASFPVGAGKWGTEEEANRHHSSMQSPWVVRGLHCTLVGTLSLEKVEDAKIGVDFGFELAKKLFGVEPSPANRPIVVIGDGDAQYMEFGDMIGGADSSHSVFIAEDVMEIPGIPVLVQPVFVNYSETSWRPFDLRHAGAVAYIEAVRRDLDAIIPEWFVRGVGSYAGRHFGTDEQPYYWSGYFGEQDITYSGGVKDPINTWFNSFTIGGLDRNGIDHNIYHAGLMIRFAMAPEELGDGRVSDAWQEVIEVFREGNGRGTARAIDKLEKSYYSQQAKIRAFLQFMIQNK